VEGAPSAGRREAEASGRGEGTREAEAEEQARDAMPFCCVYRRLCIAKQIENTIHRRQKPICLPFCNTLLNLA
jgi:hypothetical protein